MEFLIVDGYNIINAWPELNKLKEESFEHARINLIENLVNYHGATQIRVVLVFDAHQVKGGMERREYYFGVEVVYTREGESADMFIERLVGNLVRIGKVFVATSDWIEQSIILQKGAFRISARELQTEIKAALVKNMAIVQKEDRRTSLDKHLPEDVREKLERWRRGQK